jgi:hypothetical protein
MCSRQCSHERLDARQAASKVHQLLQPGAASMAGQVLQVVLHTPPTPEQAQALPGQSGPQQQVAMKCRRKACALGGEIGNKAGGTTLDKLSPLRCQSSRYMSRIPWTHCQQLSCLDACLHHHLLQLLVLLRVLHKPKATEHLLQHTTTLLLFALASLLRVCIEAIHLILPAFPYLKLL